ncbi:LOW QUALITY PROTEIN: selenoprotein S [Python bivittatus]|uniref:LOW QUALITY PROTEIN: selenoprotein S n=1 Tax=Python bivittatus TaxID=176946 RepID=A0A9F2QAV5_PYTBI|nr:LOW QUALITY PROTEIN: selenoprotein S [Python bivittatus]
MEGDAPPPAQGPPVGQEGVQFLLHAVSSLLSDYGWYILFSLIAIYLLVHKLSKNLQGARKRYAPVTAVEPDAVVKQQEALLAARMKMQEKLNAQAEKFKERQKMVEEEKRRQKIAMWESMQEGKSYKETLQHHQEPKPGASTSKAVSKPKSSRKPLRGDGYNPLSGEGGGLVRGDQDAEALPQVDEANSTGVFL